jgi:hypothetical protein
VLTRYTRAVAESCQQSRQSYRQDFWNITKFDFHVYGRVKCSPCARLHLRKFKRVQQQLFRDVLIRLVIGHQVTYQPLKLAYESSEQPVAFREE